MSRHPDNPQDFKLDFDDDKKYERRMSKSQYRDRELDPEYQGIENDISKINLEIAKQNSAQSNNMSPIKSRKTMGFPADG